MSTEADPRERRGRHVLLRPLEPRLLPAVHHLVNQAESSATWRSGGRYLSGPDLEHFLTSGVALSRVAFVDPNGPAVGLLEISAEDLRHGHGHVSVLIEEHHQRTGLAAEATMIFLDECFALLDLRHAYLLMTEKASERCASGFRRLLELCGVLPDHVRIDGRYQDVTIARVAKDSFVEHVVRDPIFSRLAVDGWRCDTD